MGEEKTLDGITGEIVDAAYKLHTGLGRGCWSPSMRSCWPAICSDAVYRSSDRSPFHSNMTASVSTMVFVSTSWWNPAS